MWPGLGACGVYIRLISVESALDEKVIVLCSYYATVRVIYVDNIV
jgi:hypothetical protein